VQITIHDLGDPVRWNLEQVRMRGGAGEAMA
jgi:hypothetical protein